MYFLNTCHVDITVDISLKAEIELKMMLREGIEKEELEHSANDISNILVATQSSR